MKMLFWGILFLILVLLLERFIKCKRKKDIESNYRERKYLLSRSEKDFYDVLKSIIGSDYSVFCKVRVLDLVDIPSRPGLFWPAFKSVLGKHVDFVLCETGNLRIVCVIELDDSSHKELKRSKRDTVIENAFCAADVKLLRFPVQFHYSCEEIADKIADIIFEKRGEKS